MRLNKYRYKVGCEQVKYTHGTLALLLPYRDFKQGDGKLVECIAKAPRFPNGSENTSKGHGSKDNNCNISRHTLGILLSRNSKYNIVVEGGCNSMTFVQPLANLFFGPAPLRPKREVPRSRAHRHVQATAALLSKARVEDKMEQPSLHNLERVPLQRLAASKVCEAATAGRKTTVCSVHFRYGFSSSLNTMWYLFAHSSCCRCAFTKFVEHVLNKTTWVQAYELTSTTWCMLEHVCTCEQRTRSSSPFVRVLGTTTMTTSSLMTVGV